jgi:UDP-glucuronate decarboxylase
MGALNMLELAVEHKALFFQASTSEVYGDPEVHPQVENYRGAVNPIGIRACYDEGKRVAESLIYDFQRQHKLDVRVARIFNTYGPQMDPKDGRVVSNFIMQALRGDDITIYGDGTQTRSFCYVDDLIAGFHKLIQSNYTLPVNIGNPDEFKVKDLADFVIQKTKTKSKITYQALPSDDPLQRCPNINLAFEKLGWAPKIKLDQGLDQTIEYFKTYL